MLQLEGVTVCTKTKTPYRREAPRKAPTVITVTSQGRTFSEVLGCIKASVRPEEAPGIVNVQKRDEGVRIVVGPQQARETARLLQEKVKGVRVETTDPKQRMVLRGLDGSATADEVKGELTRRLKCGSDDVVVSSVKQLSSGGQIALVSVPASLVRSQQLIRVGFNTCRLVASDQDRCFRCWGKGHSARNCKGPDRSQQCFKCLQTGHKISECTSQAFSCADCRAQGHRTGNCSRRHAREEGEPRPSNG